MQDKIGKLIKEMRVKNNLTQKELAEKYGVTYQAVSKWENGKNIPDIMILKEMSKDFGIDINDFLEGNEIKKRKIFTIIIFIIIVILISSVVIFLIIKDKKDKDFEFKTLSTTCSSFTIKGTIAYNKSKTSIHIANIEYCGGLDNKEYTSINCRLYETDNNNLTLLDELKYEGNITLEEYLKQVEFKVDDYNACKIYLEHPYTLEIKATTKNGETISYDVPLTLEDCN